MIRLMKFSALWALLVVAGLVAVAAGTWGLTFSASEKIVTAFLVLGLACVLPVSLAVADHVVLGPGRRPGPAPSDNQMMEMTMWFFM